MTNEEFQKPSHSKLESSIRKHNKKVTRQDLKEYAKKMSVKHDTKRTGFSKTAKDLLEPKKGEKHLKGYEY